MKKGVVYLLLFLLLVVIVTADKLTITDVDVEVDDKSDNNLDDGDTIGREAEPGSEIVFEVEVFNEFTKEEDIEIDDIEIEVTIEDIDDGDDLDDESDDFDLKPQRDHSETLRFTVPFDADEKDYDVIIKAVGDDENGTTHSDEIELTLEVERDTHRIDIVKAIVNPDSIKCGRNSFLDVRVTNTGSNEEDVTLRARGLNLDVREDIELDEDDSFSRSYTLDTRDVHESGDYPIRVYAYADDKLSDSRTTTLTVRDCEKPIIQPVREPEEEVVVVYYDQPVYVPVKKCFLFFCWYV